MDLVAHASVELDRAHICIEIESCAQPEDDLPTGDVPVGQLRPRPADRPQKNGIRLVAAMLERAFRPLLPGLQPILTSARDDRALKHQRTALFDDIQQLLRLVDDLGTGAVAGQYRQAVGHHESATGWDYMNASIAAVAE